MEGIDGIDLSDDDASALAAKRLGGTFADVSVATDNGDFTRDHNVEGTIQSVDKGVAATVEVVELSFGDRVIHIEGGNEKFSDLLQFVEAVNTRSGFLGDAFPLLDESMENIGMFGMNLFEKVFDDFFFLARAGCVDPTVAVFEFITFVKEESDVASVIDDELGSESLGVEDGFPSAVPVLLKSFPFPSENGNTRCGDGGGRLILGGENIAARPTNIGPELDERFDQNSSLNRHVEGARDANTGEGLALGILFANGHETGHFLFCDLNFFASEFSQGNIFDFVFGGGFRGFGYFCFWFEGCSGHGEDLLLGLI